MPKYIAVRHGSDKGIIVPDMRNIKTGKQIYEFQVEAVSIGIIDSVEVQAETLTVALEKVQLWTRESNSMTGRNDAVREKPVWISDFYVS